MFHYVGHFSRSHSFICPSSTPHQERKVLISIFLSLTTVVRSFLSLSTCLSSPVIIKKVESFSIKSSYMWNEGKGDEGGKGWKRKCSVEDNIEWKFLLCSVPASARSKKKVFPQICIEIKKRILSIQKMVRNGVRGEMRRKYNKSWFQNNNCGDQPQHKRGLDVVFVVVVFVVVVIIKPHIRMKKRKEKRHRNNL